MSHFAKNPTDFSAACQIHDGECAVSRDNILFLDNGDEAAAVDQLVRECGHVVIIPDASSNGKALLYHTSCQRMTDAVQQIFQDSLGDPVGLPQQGGSELSLGELQRRPVSIPFGDCRARVDAFDF